MQLQDAKTNNQMLRSRKELNFKCNGDNIGKYQMGEKTERQNPQEIQEPVTVKDKGDRERKRNSPEMYLRCTVSDQGTV